MATKKQTPEQLKKNRFFNSLQNELHDKIKTLTESVNANNEEITYLRREIISIRNKLDSIEEYSQESRAIVLKFDKDYTSEFNKLYTLILILMIAVALISVNIFISVIK